MLTDILTYNLKMVICGTAAGNKSTESYPQGWLDYGLQPETTGDKKLFVAPSTSGAASRYWDIELWRELVKINL